MHNYMFRKFYVVKCGGAVEVGFRFFWGTFLLLESRVWPSGVDRAPPRHGVPAKRSGY